MNLHDCRRLLEDLGHLAPGSGAGSTRRFDDEARYRAELVLRLLAEQGSELAESA